MSNEAEIAANAQKQYHESMPKLSIEMNSRIHVRINPLSQQSRAMPGEFLGICHYDFLILRIPSVPGLRNQLLPRTLVEVRFLLDGAINSFYAEVITHVIKPALIVFITYPDKLSIMEMRNHRRILCALPVSINSAHGDGFGIISDLSQGGCRINVELTGQSALRQVAVDEAAVLQFSLTPDGSSVGCTAIVRSLTISGALLVIGVSFDQPVEEFVRVLNGYLGLVQAVF